MNNLIFLYFRKESHNLTSILAMQQQLGLFSYFKYTKMPSISPVLQSVLVVKFSFFWKKLFFLLSDAFLLLISLNNKIYTVKQFLSYKAFVWKVTFFKSLFFRCFQFKINLFKIIVCLKKKCLAY